MKTKVKFNRSNFDVNVNEVGYIDAYVVKNNDIYACIIIGNRLVYAEKYIYDIITEDEFVKADQNTRIVIN
jgi:hypothetical protein